MKKVIFIIICFMFLTSLSIRAENLSIEELINSKEVGIEEVHKEQGGAQKEANEQKKQTEEGIKAFLKKYFENFDNFKLLVVLTLPISAFLAATSSLSSLAEERYERMQCQLKRMETLASKLNKELEELDSELQLLMEERKRLAEALINGGVIRKHPIDNSLKVREKWLDRLVEVKRALLEKFYVAGGSYGKTA